MKKKYIRVMALILAGVFVLSAVSMAIFSISGAM